VIALGACGPRSEPRPSSRESLASAASLVGAAAATPSPPVDSTSEAGRDSPYRSEPAARDSLRADTPDGSWRTFRSERRRLSFRYPRSFRPAIVGPTTTECDDSSARPYDDLGDSVVARPPAARGASSRGTIRLRFVRAPLDSVADANGFVRSDDDWYTVGRMGSRQAAVHDSTPVWDRFEGDALVGVDAPGGGTALADDYRMLIVFRRSDGCSVAVTYWPRTGSRRTAQQYDFADFRRAAGTMRFAPPSAVAPR
jgi:hypothetical protein